MIFKFVFALAVLFCQPSFGDSPHPKAPNSILPEFIKSLPKRIQMCHHFAGEEPYDEERAKQIGEAVKKYDCLNVEKDLKKAYKLKPKFPLEVRGIIEKAKETEGYYPIPK